MFDEADALFGKCTEVRDSHDRYANIEINYLLQKIEEYNGLCISSTNKRSVIDEAFLRRLKFAVEFPMPDAKQRRKIWRKWVSGGGGKGKYRNFQSSIIFYSVGTIRFYDKRS